MKARHRLTCPSDGRPLTRAPGTKPGERECPGCRRIWDVLEVTGCV